MLDNPNPIVTEIVEMTYKRPTGMLDSNDIFNVIRNIRDPEHPYTLEQLKVVSCSQILIDTDTKALIIRFTPTVPHCSLTSLIGLMIRVKLMRYLPSCIKIHILIQEGTHYQEKEINKQLNDKERVAAAMENIHLMEVVEYNIGEWMQ
ncbi:hypothetical protein SteCoe_32225 [Stentor coeruleus]|uniref:Uncharacterized protein n=1 Tax=Stentor coeruleus TaxID=5963 RepID=A0A1R2AZX7_9CILI|nr:hypothetical protein SteCoe_32225 [Stentor coeruleus]